MSTGVNEGALGKRYEAPAFEVTEEVIRAYAEATNDDDPRHVGEAPIAPPIFPVRPLVSVLFGAIEDPELGIDLKRLVHGEQDMRLFDALRPGDRVVPTAEVVAIEARSTGQVVSLRQRLERGGELVTEVTSALFVRGESSGKKGNKKRVGPEDPGAPAFEVSARVDEDQSLRYAQASGDLNPLHTDPEFARAAGLPGVILHGLCTMAIATRAVVASACGGDSRRLARVSVRFARPVFPGQELTTRIWAGEPVEGEEGVIRHAFETVNEDGRAVLSRAVAQVRMSGG